MITVVSGTNRKGSECLAFARKYAELLEGLGEESVQVLALEEIPHDWFFPEMYDKEQQATGLIALQDQYILGASKFAFFSPEYNGGFPGSLKLFIDGISIREYSRNFKGKKAALVGIATGRAGNLRGMDHLGSVLQHMGTIIMPNKLPISSIGKLVNDQGAIIDEGTLQVMTQHAQELIDF